MKFREIRAVYDDGLFVSFLETTLESFLDYLKEDNIIDEVRFI